MRKMIWLALVVLILSACAPAMRTPAPDSAQSALPSSTPLALDSPSETPDPAATATLPPAERPPARAEREFTTDFSKHSVPYTEIRSGGPPKDGIQSIDEPEFIDVIGADEWLAGPEPVILIQVENDVRVYPIQILMFHEIVNDTVGDTPVAVTFCPLCNTAIAFERVMDGQTLDFGTTGRLRYSNLVMYDRQTESWWQQATGEAIVGEFTGRRLTFVPAPMISWTDAKTTHPDAQVLSRTSGSRQYGYNPYAGYDRLNRTSSLYVGPKTPDVLPPLARVLTVALNDDTVAYPYDLLRDLRVVNDTAGDVAIAVLWTPGTVSALDASTVAGGRDVGAANVFARDLDGQLLSFVFEDEVIRDEQTGSEWDGLGRAIGGPLEGRRLEPIVSVNHFWFSWAAFRPETRVYDSNSSASAEPSTSPTSAASSLPGDFEIKVYQGDAVLGSPSITFSEVLAQGKPVVLNFWAGLCPICRAEMPGLQKAYEEYKDRVLCVGVDIGPSIGLGTPEDGVALLDELSISYPAGTTPDASVLRDYQVLGTPTTVFISPGGDIVQRWTGRLTDAQLVDFTETLLETIE